MSRSSTTLGIGLGIAILLQLLILFGMVGTSALPMWTGTEIHVKTTPIDPRSLFRGNYAQLNYAFSQLPENALSDATRLRNGEIVYVTLQPGNDGLHELVDASLDKPADGIFLRGRIANPHPPYRVKYGIEAFFAPKEKALRLEDELRSGGVAILMVTAGGKVALKDVVPNREGE